MAIAAMTGIMFVALALLVALHPAPFFFDRPVSVAVQSVNFSPLEPFHVFVSAFSGWVGVAVGAAVIAATFLLMRRATAFVAFSAVYSMVYNGVNLLIRRPRPTGWVHTAAAPGRIQLPERTCCLLRLAGGPGGCPDGTAPAGPPLPHLLGARAGAGAGGWAEPG